jgi:hypothetical protein
MSFLKENLQGHYNWNNSGNTGLFSGTPTRRFFDRDNGEQVLFIINFYGSTDEKFNVEEGHRLEELINKRLPAETRSEISVYNWLKEASMLIC